MTFHCTRNRAIDLHLHTLVAQGNHSAFLKLKNRYEKYSRIISRQFYEKNLDSGVEFFDLFLVCMSSFKSVLVKYDPQGRPLYDFWKKVTEQALYDYLLVNSYKAKAKTFNGVISLDYEEEEKKLNLELIRENDEDYLKDKLKREIIKIIDSHKDSFSKKEFLILHYNLEGYSIRELEHGEIMSRSSLYATSNSANRKLEELIREVKKK